jgi:hypothetical protein
MGRRGAWRRLEGNERGPPQQLETARRAETTERDSQIPESRRPLPSSFPLVQTEHRASQSPTPVGNNSLQTRSTGTRQQPDTILPTNPTTQNFFQFLLFFFVRNSLLVLDTQTGWTYYFIKCPQKMTEGSASHSVSKTGAHSVIIYGIIMVQAGESTYYSRGKLN